MSHETAQWHSIPFQSADGPAALDLIQSSIEDQQHRHFHLCNAWTSVLAYDNVALRQVLQDSFAVNLVDGEPLRRSLARSSGLQFQGIRGPELFSDALQLFAAQGVGQALVGGTAETLQTISRRLEGKLATEDQTGLTLYSPPFAPVDDNYIEAIVAAIGGRSVQVVWVGLGTPKQDIVAKDVARSLGVPVVCVGAAFSFYAGHVREAPRILRGSGFEWVWRFASEPLRLFRRYSYGVIRFLLLDRRHRRESGAA